VHSLSEEGVKVHSSLKREFVPKKRATREFRGWRRGSIPNGKKGGKINCRDRRSWSEMGEKQGGEFFDV